MACRACSRSDYRINRKRVACFVDLYHISETAGIDLRRFRHPWLCFMIDRLFWI
jgi:hypothetical protein